MDKDLLKDVFLHGVTHADMGEILIDSKDIVSSYDNASVYDYLMKCEKYEKEICYGKVARDLL